LQKKFDYFLFFYVDDLFAKDEASYTSFKKTPHTKNNDFAYQ